VQCHVVLFLFPHATGPRKVNLGQGLVHGTLHSGTKASCAVFIWPFYVVFRADPRQAFMHRGIIVVLNTSSIHLVVKHGPHHVLSVPRELRAHSRLNKREGNENRRLKALVIVRSDPWQAFPGKFHTTCMTSRMHPYSPRRPIRVRLTLCWDHSSFSKEELLTVAVRSDVDPGLEPGVEGLPPDTSLPDIGIRKTTPAAEVLEQPEALQESVVASCVESRLPEHGAKSSRPACPFAGAGYSGAAPVGATDSQRQPWATDMQPVSNLPMCFHNSAQVRQRPLTSRQPSGVTNRALTTSSGEARGTMPSVRRSVWHVPALSPPPPRETQAVVAVIHVRARSNHQK